MWQIFKHEIRLMLREPRFLMAFLLPPLVLLGAQAFLFSQTAGEAPQLDGMMLLLVGALITTMSVTLTADSFAGERERNTLELLLALPLKPEHLFWGKLSAILVFPLVLAFAAQGILWTFFSQVGWYYLITAWIYSLALCLFITALALYISLRSATVRSAAQINVIFVLFFLFLTNFGGVYYFNHPAFPAVALSFSLLGSWIITRGARRRFLRLG